MGIKVQIGKFSITSKRFFRVLMVLIWTQHTIFPFIIEVVKRLPIIGVFSPFVMPTMFILLIILSMRYILTQVRMVDIFFYMTCIVIVLGSMLFLYKNAFYIEQELWRILGLSVPLYFVGVAYSHEESKNDIFWCSLVIVIVMFVYQIYMLNMGRVLHADNMDTSYKVLPSVMYLAYWALENRGIKNWFWVSIGTVLLFIFGTRGAILALLIFLTIGSAFTVLKGKNILLKVVYLMLCGYVIYFVSSGENMIELSQKLSRVFSEYGFSTRIFDFIIEGELDYDSGRSILSSAILDAIKEKPMIGYGFMGDRVIIGFYVHNIFYEVLCHYGIPLGIVVLGTMIGIPLCAYRMLYPKDESNIILMFMCLVFTKLMLTGSYVYEPYLYLLLGISIGVFRKVKVRKGIKRGD